MNEIMDGSTVHGSNLHNRELHVLCWVDDNQHERAMNNCIQSFTPLNSTHL